MVRNHSLNILKKDREGLISLEDEMIDHDVLQQSAVDPEDALLNDESVERLASYIRQMTFANRQVLEYKLIEGHSNLEIANILGISQSAVSSRIDKGRKRLRELLEGEEL